MAYRSPSTWYDDYDFNHNGSDDVAYEADTEHFPDHEVSQLLRGKVTGIKVRILDKDSDMPDWIQTVTFYDTYGREIQTQADNHLTGIDITWKEYKSSESCS